MFSILAYFVTTHLNYLQCAFNRIIKKIPISQNPCLLKIANLILFSVFFIQNLLSQCGNIEKNPGPKYSYLSFFHWNLNGLTAHDYIKTTLIQACITDQNFDIVCLSETFLNSSIQNDDYKLKTNGYNLIRSDHPGNSKKGGVCIYYKEHIPLIRRDELCTLGNCLVTEIQSQSEKCFSTCAYRSFSQSQEEFEIFCTYFDILLSQINYEFPLCSIATGDFNTRCTNWWVDDISYSAGREIASLTSSAGYTQIIDKPTHVINNSMSCIIFCTDQNVISKYGVDASIFEKCHHNIYGKIDIRIPLPPKYVREVWDYSKADVQNIKKSIKEFNWGKTFESLSIDSKADLLNETLLNIFRNYIPNKKIKCDYHQPPWMTNSRKRSLK